MQGIIFAAPHLGWGVRESFSLSIRGVWGRVGAGYNKGKFSLLLQFFLAINRPSLESAAPGVIEFIIATVNNVDIFLYRRRFVDFAALGISISIVRRLTGMRAVLGR